MTRTGPASFWTTGVGVSVEGPIAKESNGEMAGGLDEDGPAAPLDEVSAAASLDDSDKGSFDAFVVDIAFFDDSAGLVFSLVISDDPLVAAKFGVMGDVEGIETSLRRPCDPAPSLLELGISVISTGSGDCGVELDR